MPEKHPKTRRWGGPGASHEDASKPMQPPPPAHPPGAVGTSPRVSKVLGGGGERDEKHSAVDTMRHANSNASDGPSPTSDREADRGGGGGPGRVTPRPGTDPIRPGRR